ncbi:unnamed protein product [Adineta steineri]|uniref:Uncharacterized protein n=1 Tax=Adineta steineri TaxID=433720 RepID=A0A818WCS0_9BILA|nr:unnamed protein product [Adineta steineri]CAF3723095.1 unnamed protein product [Adineta steineri]
MFASTIRSSRLNNNNSPRRNFYVSSKIDHRIGRGIHMFNNNGYGYSFRWHGFILGCLIILFSAALLSSELGRIYTGSINRGRNDSNVTYQYLIDANVVIDFNGDIRNPKSENRWIWPWSTATLLFSLVILLTGALGITSGVRQSYSTILTFFVGLLVSIFLLIFVIATYGTIIAGWKGIDNSNGGFVSSFERNDKSFASACLAISCVLFIILLISLVLSGRTIHICKQKDYPRPNTPGYTPISAPNTPGAFRRTPQMPRTPRF